MSSKKFMRQQLAEARKALVFATTERDYWKPLAQKTNDLNTGLHLELKLTKEVLRDALEQRTGGASEWLAQLAMRRAELLGFLRRAARRFEWVEGGAIDHDAANCSQECCGRHCPQANMLRIVGGSEETQRQVEAAHDAAHEAAIAAARTYVVDRSITFDLGSEPDRTILFGLRSIDVPRFDADVEVLGERFGTARPVNATELQTPPSGESVKP